MSLYGRITATDDSKIAVHRLMAAMVEYQRGQLTGPQVKGAFSLDATESAELQAIIDALDGQANLAAKIGYLEAIHSVFILSETGDYTEAKAKSSLGF